MTLPLDIALSVTTTAKFIKAGKNQEQLANDAYKHDPYVPKMSAYIGGGVPHVIMENNKTIGYAKIDANFNPADACNMPFGYVCDIIAHTRDAALAVIKKAAQLAQKNGDKEICLMYSHMTLTTRTMINLGGTYILRSSCDLPGLDAEMVAIIDLPSLTKSLKQEFRNRLKNRRGQNIEASFSIEMQGEVVGFKANKGEFEIIDKKQPVHRILPRWLVTRLYMGYYSGEDIFAMGPIPDGRNDGKTPDNKKLDMKEFKLPENEAELFKALFPKLWPTSLPDPDVWPWVISQKHLIYQHNIKKIPAVKDKIDKLKFPWFGY